MSIVAELKAPTKSVSWNKTLIVKANPLKAAKQSLVLTGNRARRMQMKNKALWKRQPRRLPLMKYRKERLVEVNAVDETLVEQAKMATERKPRMLPLAKYRSNEENNTLDASANGAEKGELNKE
ncbi:hypothetical protein HJC23_004688 [Cyclotella cryptica]|uniref:Uncharacterized protein n=1 Tax=Cyclotella cryptica TaxID=29204 RepID=A0ABD3PLL4_9STRA|eukprot:CCRYP_013915-RA/>CCRYP_013915-RA protein AED:0.44 eAED:0.44 QI:0/-1/0/1/-1/1/1/0/123